MLPQQGISVMVRERHSDLLREADQERLVARAAAGRRLPISFRLLLEVLRGRFSSGRRSVITPYRAAPTPR